MLMLIFLVFFKIGLFSIGGGYAVIPMIQNEVVGRQHWVSDKVFTDIITISQMTPGPLAINTSTFVGLQTAGISGAVTASVGCAISGVLISLFLYRFFQKHKGSAYVFEVMKGLKSASIGLIMSAAGVILMITFFGSAGIADKNNFFQALDRTAVCIFLVSFLLLRKWKLNPMLIMLLTGISGAILYGGNLM